MKPVVPSLDGIRRYGVRLDPVELADRHGVSQNGSMGLIGTAWIPPNGMRDLEARATIPWSFKVPEKIAYPCTGSLELF